MDFTKMIREYSPKYPQEEADKLLFENYIVRFPDILSRSNPLCHCTAACWITNPARTKVLLAWHNIYRSWSWTGGHADGDGDLMRVAMREAREETGLARIEPVQTAPVSLELLPVAAHVRRGAFVSAHLHLNLTFLFCADEAEPLAIQPDENSALGWFSPEEAVERCTEDHMRPIYEKLNSRL